MRRGLLRLLVKDVDVPSRGVVVRDVEPDVVALAERHQLLVVLLRQRYLLEVRLDALCCRQSVALRQVGTLMTYPSARTWG